jgi:exodeoxyribonuclease V
VIRVTGTGAVAAPITPDWSPQQLDAIAAITAWLDRGDQPSFYLAGYAGTGKTTLLRSLAQSAGELVLFGAYTGKAASVMARKGCADATTIDQLIYHHPFIWQCQAECRKPPCAELCAYAWQLWLGRRLNPKSAVTGADLTVIDECSMLPLAMWEDLLSFERPVLVVGDPGQLPPVEGTGFLVGREPDAFLSKIHRQAEGDPIIHLATLARRGQRLPLGRLGASEVTLQMPRDLAAYDAVICGRNATRRRLNQMIRAQLGFRGPLPQRGERLVILRS